MGLKTSVYWIVNYLFNYVLYVLAATLLVCIACAMGTLKTTAFLK